ncbi:MAG: hypothetical protein V9G20_16265 [Candidatus Promineifilaceae bacterium]
MGLQDFDVGRFGKRCVSGELLRKCRAIWQIARTIYQIVLQIFLLVRRRPMGNSYENSHG